MIIKISYVFILRVQVYVNVTLTYKYTIEKNIYYRASLEPELNYYLLFKNNNNIC